jgi:hypothetical protein
MKTIKIVRQTKLRSQYSTGESTMELGSRREIEAPLGYVKKTKGYTAEVPPTRRFKKDTTSPGW